MNLEEIQNEIASIKERNSRVEADKAWEVSWSRRAVIAVITYLVSGFLLFLIDNPLPPLTALVPTFGYILSTFSIPLAKKWWLNIKKYD